MEKQWYTLGCYSGHGDIILKMLNKLSEAGITPENIKTFENWIYYYHSEELYYEFEGRF